MSTADLLESAAELIDAADSPLTAVALAAKRHGVLPGDAIVALKHYLDVPNIVAWHDAQPNCDAVVDAVRACAEWVRRGGQ